MILQLHHDEPFHTMADKGTSNKVNSNFQQIIRWHGNKQQSPPFKKNKFPMMIVIKFKMCSNQIQITRSKPANLKKYFEVEQDEFLINTSEQIISLSTRVGIHTHHLHGLFTCYLMERAESILIKLLSLYTDP